MSDPTLELHASNLVPAQYDRTEASVRRRTVEAALQSSHLRVSGMFESGSWTHGTSIKAKSDVDYMAIATGTRPVYPSSALDAAKRAIQGCDWKITRVAVSSPVVAVTYLRPPHFEIAPCWYDQTIRGFDVYRIAGRADEWVLSAPRAHLPYVNKQNDRLNKKLKPLVRLLKAWKYHVSAPISSFYLEMRAAEYATGESTIIYDIDLRAVMRSIISMGARDMNDPAHIVGRIPGCASEDKRRLATRLLEESLGNLYTADQARTVGDRSRYWLSMREVFGGDYPWPTW
jgi:hypothetical protein